MVANMLHKGLDGGEKELSSKVWGNFPLRSSLALIGGAGRLAYPLQIQHEATTDHCDTAADDIIAVTAGAFAHTKTEDGDALAMVDAKTVIFGFSDLQVAIDDGKRWALEASLNNATAVSHGIFLGLASYDDVGAPLTTATNLTSVASVFAQNTASIVGLFKMEAQADYAAITKKDAITDGSKVILEAAAATSTNGASLKLGINSDGKNIRFFVDNAQVGSPVSVGNANLPAESDLCPVLSVTGSDATTLNVRYLAFAYAR